MATSRSSEAVWQGTALLYSGRPDPVWDVRAHDAMALERLWSGLAPLAGPAPQPPALGYRGCRISAPSREWLAYGGVVMLRASEAQDVRVDPARSFERAALATAPAGLLPAAALPLEVKR